jgi:hypothetical protein
MRSASYVHTRLDLRALVQELDAVHLGAALQLVNQRAHLCAGSDGIFLQHEQASLRGTSGTSGTSAHACRLRGTSAVRVLGRQRLLVQ